MWNFWFLHHLQYSDLAFTPLYVIIFQAQADTLVHAVKPDSLLFLTGTHTDLRQDGDTF